MDPSPPPPPPPSSSDHNNDNNGNNDDSSIDTICYQPNSKKRKLEKENETSSPLVGSATSNYDDLEQEEGHAQEKDEAALNPFLFPNLDAGTEIVAVINTKILSDSSCHKSSSSKSSFSSVSSLDSPVLGKEITTPTTKKKLSSAASPAAVARKSGLEDDEIEVIKVNSARPSLPAGAKKDDSSSSSSFSDASSLSPCFEHISRTKHEDSQPPPEQKIKSAEDLALMSAVDHKVRSFIQKEDGKRIMTITVMNSETETLYDFRIETGISSIPNSGYGAFLTFLGARVLTPSAYDRSEQILDGKMIINPPTRTVDLTASIKREGSSNSCSTYDGTSNRNDNVAVSLTGDNLHGNGNNPYFSVTRFPLHATVHDKSKNDNKIRDRNNNSSKNRKTITVRVGPSRVHEDIDALRKNREIPCRVNGLGHFGMHSEKDYIPDDDITFSSYDDGCGLIDIGRYGPFLKSDRKTLLEFNFKDFIFAHEPAGWSFGVSEKLDSCQQIIDITSDCTGEPHQAAKDNIPMYVNEIGHNENLSRNILSREKDDRIVHYYLHFKQPLKKGQTVELLTCYDTQYEEVRERKGYGKLNLYSDVKGDDDHNERTKRDLADRRLIDVTIQTMSVGEFAKVVHFILTKISNPLKLLIEWDTSTNKSRLTKRQWIARRRISWLLNLFHARLETTKATRNCKEIFTHIKLMLDQMKWHLVWKDIKTRTGESVPIILREEIMQEHLFVVSKDELLGNIFDSTIWSEMSRKLMENTARTIATHHLENIGSSSVRKLVELSNHLVQLTVNGAKNLRSLCEALQSNSTSSNDFLRGFQSICMNPSPVCNSTQGSRNYEQASNSNNLQESSDPDNLTKPAHIPSSFIHSVATGKTTLYQDGNHQWRDMTNKMICQQEGLRHGVLEIDYDWYLLHQILRVIHIFASHCVEWNENGLDGIYSLDSLLKHHKINVWFAKEILDTPMFDQNTNRSK